MVEHDTIHNPQPSTPPSSAEENNILTSFFFLPFVAHSLSPLSPSSLSSLSSPSSLLSLLPPHSFFPHPPLLPSSLLPPPSLPPPLLHSMELSLTLSYISRCQPSPSPPLPPLSPLPPPQALPLPPPLDHWAWMAAASCASMRTQSAQWSRADTSARVLRVGSACVSARSVDRIWVESWRSTACRSANMFARFGQM